MWCDQFASDYFAAVPSPRSEAVTCQLQVCALRFDQLRGSTALFCLCVVWRRRLCDFSQESEGDSDDMWDRSSESESSTSDEEGRPIGTLTADFFRKKWVPLLQFVVSNSFWKLNSCENTTPWIFSIESIIVVVIIIVTSFQCFDTVGCQEGHSTVKNWVMSYWHAHLSGARYKWFAYAPAVATATPSSLASLKFRLV